MYRCGSIQSVCRNLSWKAPDKAPAELLDRTRCRSARIDSAAQLSHLEAHRHDVEKVGGQPSPAFTNEELVDQNGASWNPLISWLRKVEGLRRAA
jgi:hypothetical protein